MAVADARLSLPDGSVDEEVDATVGTEICITWVGRGAAAVGAGGANDEMTLHHGMGARRLGRAIHGALHAVAGNWRRRDLVGGPTHDSGLSFVLSSDDKDTASGLFVWTHASTFSALALPITSCQRLCFMICFLPLHLCLTFSLSCHYIYSQILN